MVALLLVAAATAVAAYLLMLAAAPPWSWPERALAGTAGIALVVQTELHALDALPVDRPLTAAPFVHVVVIVAISLWSLQRLRRNRTRETQPWEVVAAAGPAGLIVLGLIGVSLLVILGWGVATGPSSVDEFSYHVPQAAFIYQDADLGRPDAYLPWTYAYPRGASMLWSFTMFFTGDERGFQVVQTALAAQLLLATYVLARRSSASRVSSLLACLLLATAPVFFRMATLSTADMAFAAGTVTAVAFLAPRDVEARRLDLVVAGIGVAQAFSAKPPFLALLLVGAAGLHVTVRERWWLRGSGGSWKGRAAATSAMAVAAVVGMAPYIINWLRYRNPVWPLALHLPGVDLSGPLPAFTDQTIGAQTGFGLASEMSRLELWIASLFDWGHPLNEDSLGSFGPGIAVIGTLLFVVGTVRAVQERDTWALTLCAAAIVGIVAVPVLFIPRYGLPVIAVVLAIAAVGARRVPGGAAMGPLAVTAVVAVAAAATVPSMRLMQDTARWYDANGEEPWYRDRGHSVAENHRLNVPTVAPRPEFVRHVRSTFEADASVVYSVGSYPTLFWNLDFSNRAVYVPPTEAETYPVGLHNLTEPTEEDIRSWARAVEAMEADHVVVYRAGPLDDLLLRTAGWQVTYEDPVSEGPTALRVLSRSSGS